MDLSIEKLQYDFIKRKEFQTLLDSTKEKIGNGTIFLSFSSDNDICLASDDL
jgi:hypothetical protein